MPKSNKIIANGSDITIVIITYNRYPFLLRLLRFYDQYNYQFDLLILDSSSDELDSKMDSYLKRENIIYKKYDSSIFFTNKIADGCQSVTTPYVVLCADDDFLIPSGLLESRNFLQENQDYASAHGFYFNHTSAEKVKKYGFSINPMSKKIKSTNQTTGFLRIQAYLSGELSHYPLYAVHRSATFCTIWNETDKYVSDWGLSELFPCCMSFAYGKMKVLPVFYSSREPNTFSWTDENRINIMYTKDKINLASKGISILLSSIDQITAEEAFNLMQATFKKYLSRSKEKKLSSSNYAILYWNRLKGKIAIRTKIRSLFYNGYHSSISKNYYEDYKKVKHSVIDANISNDILNFSRKQYSKMNNT